MPNYSQSRAESQVQTGQRVAMLDLLTDSHEVTMGTGGYKWRPVSDILVDAGPRLEAITTYYKLADASANFKVKLRGTWSIDGLNWEVFAADLMSEVTACREPDRNTGGASAEAGSAW